MRREEGLTLVIISHDLEDMDLACTRAVEVADGTVTMPDVPARRGRTPRPWRRRHDPGAPASYSARCLAPPRSTASGRRQSS